MSKIKCLMCSNEFIPNSVSKTCSLKCRLLEGIEKLENGCWIWKRTRGGDYGKVRWLSKTISAHRASYLTFKGEIASQLNVCHKCDNPICINPDHLWLGTQKENKRDAKQKGRIPIGLKNHFSKFTDEQIDEIRKLKKEGFTYERLRRIFNCSVVHLVDVIKFRVRK